MPEELAPTGGDAPIESAPIEQDAGGDQDAQEWEDAALELYPGIKSKKEKQGDEAQTGEEGQEGQEAADTKASGEGSGESQEGDGEGAEGAEEEVGQVDPNAISARLAARETAQAFSAVRSDVRDQMFSEVPSELRDADGDPIRSVEDVMKLINPRTGEAFTEEEAGMWLLAAQQKFNQDLANVEKQIDQIAEVNLDLKDQADMVMYEYGELLKRMPDLQKQIWAEYEKTLVKDPKSGIITKAPVPLQSFYKLALKPYVELAQHLEAQEANRAAAVAKKEADQEAARKQSRADRSDIYGGGKTDIKDPEDEEWGSAAEAVFGPRK